MSDTATENRPQPHYEGLDLSEESLMGDFLATRPARKTRTDNFVILNNLPVISQEKRAKLETYLKKLLAANIGKPQRLHLSTDDSGATKGYAFIELASPEMAATAVQKLHHFDFDKSHRLEAYTASAMDSLLNVSETFELDKKAIEALDNEANNRALESQFNAHLLDPSLRDQYFFHHGLSNTFEIEWFQHTYLLNKDPTNIDSSKTLIRHASASPAFHIENFAQSQSTFFSPSGRYIGVIHPVFGFAIFALLPAPEGQHSFTQRIIHKFKCSSVVHVGFSPCERYVYSLSSALAESGPVDHQAQAQAQHQVSSEGTAAQPQYTVKHVVWDLMAGSRIREFSETLDIKLTPEIIYTQGNQGSLSGVAVPTTHSSLMKWNHDGSLIAKYNYLTQQTEKQGLVIEENLSIYALPSMKRVEKISLPHNRTKTYNAPDANFEFSPVSDLLVYFVPESGDKTPARLCLMRLKPLDGGANRPACESTQLKIKNIFLSRSAAFYWQPEGNYLGVRIDKVKNQRGDPAPNLCFEFFHLKEPNIPLETFLLDQGTFLHFAWFRHTAYIDELFDKVYSPAAGENPAAATSVASKNAAARFAIVANSAGPIKPSDLVPPPPLPPTPYSRYQDQPVLPELPVSNISVFFYTIQQGKDIQKVHVLTDKNNIRSIHPNPLNSYFVLSSDTAAGELEFYDSQYKLLRRAIHPNCHNNLFYDPSGRYLATVMLGKHSRMENGFLVWDYYGNLLYTKIGLSDLKCFGWRPRAKAVAALGVRSDHKKLAKIASELLARSVAFEAHDQASLNAQTKIRSEARAAILADFVAYISSAKDYAHAQRETIMASKNYNNGLAITFIDESVDLDALV